MQQQIYQFANFLVFVTGFAQQLEHIALVKLHAGLVKGVHAQHISGNAAGQFEEVEHLAQFLVVQLAHIHSDNGNIAIHVSSQRTQECLLIDEVQSLALQIVQAVQILP